MKIFGPDFFFLEIASFPLVDKKCVTQINMLKYELWMI